MIYRFYKVEVQCFLIKRLILVQQTEYQHILICYRYPYQLTRNGINPAKHFEICSYCCQRQATNLQGQHYLHLKMLLKWGLCSTVYNWQYVHSDIDPYIWISLQSHKDIRQFLKILNIKPVGGIQPSMSSFRNFLQILHSKHVPRLSKIWSILLK